MKWGRHVLSIVLLGSMLTSVIYAEEGTISECNEETKEDEAADSPGAALNMHFLDVGQGDSILVEPVGSGGNLLIDGGIHGSEEVIIDYLEEENIDSLEWVVATHPDVDHIGGLIEVLEEMEVKNVLDSGKEHTTKTYQKYLDVMDERDIHVVKAVEGEYLDTQAAEVQILNGYHDSDTINKSSIVLHFTYGGTKVLLTGDATIENEAAMMEKYDVESDMLKVGHHGADTSTSAQFVEAVDPETAILSYGENNYGHPSENVVKTLKEAGVELYSTYESGSIEVSLHPGGADVPAAEPWTGDERTQREIPTKQLSKDLKEGDVLEVVCNEHGTLREMTINHRETENRKKKGESIFQTLKNKLV